MNLPFGIQLKGVIVGIILALVVYPWVMSLINRPAVSNQRTM